MNIIFIKLLFFTIVKALMNFNTTNFMHINDKCLMDPNLNFSCIYVTQLIWLDPIMDYDVKYICNKCKQNNFTNDQLAITINKRFKNTLLNNCSVNTINGFENIQLIEQCPFLYNETCSQ
jgi:hypothetical protein